ncbi:hypothetical protein H4Q26_016184 [Puccinia striiformis f. sp. tritici PST-130]|nr:hypothetical protein H4Q26_016184 [Puccinia striiformis f. sp. tritici PST-130]
MSASVGRIFERDAIVNGLICLESFKLVSFLIKKFNVLSKGGFTLVTRPDLSLDSRAGIYFCPRSPAQETKVSMEVWADEVKQHLAADNKKRGRLRRDLSRELKCQ